MTDPSRRRPTTFKLDAPDVIVADALDRDGGRGRVQIAPEPELLPPEIAPEASVVAVRRNGPRWAALFWSALGGLFSLAAWLWLSRLIADLFAQSETLGAIGATLAALAALALLVIVGREVVSLMRMTAIEKLHARALAVLQSDDRDEARAVVRDLLRFEHRDPRLARARMTVAGHLDDIIDGADLVRLAERELLGPLDDEARALVSTAAQRVSLVTTISPRALIDVLFVLAAALRLIRQLARLYGARPGALGMIRLTRQVVTHLAITGGIAIGDSVVQQLLGHGVAAKLSSRLGEGVLNGLLTARLGLAAIDLTRPLPFTALPRPALGDLAKDLVRKRTAEP